MPTEQWLPTLDHVLGQTTGKCKVYIKKECNSLVWIHAGGYMDAMQPIDADLRAYIKVEVGKQLNLCLENGDHLERWESNALNASDRRGLFTK